MVELTFAREIPNIMTEIARLEVLAETALKGGWIPFADIHYFRGVLGDPVKVKADGKTPIEIPLIEDGDVSSGRNIMAALLTLSGGVFNYNDVLSNVSFSFQPKK